MIYCKPLSFCFIAVPKTGTTSIESFLSLYCEENDFPHIKTKETNKPFGDVSGKHASLMAVKQHYNVSNINTIGFVRNPWDKVVSWYNYLKLHKQSKYSISDNISFEEFILTAPNFVFTESSKFITDSTGKLDVNFLGRFETINEDFKRICNNVLEIEWSPLLQLNGSNNKTHYSDFYTTKTKKIVEQYFLTDIKMFDYTFDLNH